MYNMCKHELDEPFVIRILIVCDGFLSYDLKKRMSLVNLLNILGVQHLESWCLKYEVDEVLRKDISKDFYGLRNSKETLNYDVLMLFGQSSFQNALTEDELKEIDCGMELGLGVFAAGDHGRLGSALSGSIKRVRHMQRWNDSMPDSLTNARNSVSALEQASGDFPGSQYDYKPAKISVRRYHYYLTQDAEEMKHPEATSSNEVYYPVTVHEVFSGRYGDEITVLPDHPHEGEVLEPPTFEALETLLLNVLKIVGWDSFVSYDHSPKDVLDSKKGMGFQKMTVKELQDFVGALLGRKDVDDASLFDDLQGNPEKMDQIIRLSRDLKVHSDVLGEFAVCECLNVVKAYDMLWQVIATGTFSRNPKEPKDLWGQNVFSLGTYGVVGSYDPPDRKCECQDKNCSLKGKTSQKGRILVDSSFHHWTLGNLEGVPGTDGNVRSGLERRGLRDTTDFYLVQEYHRNVVLWLVPKSKRAEMFVKILWNGLSLYDLEDSIDVNMENWQMGRATIRELGAYLGDSFMRSEWRSVVKNVPSLDLALRMSQNDLNALDEYVVGTIIHEMLALKINSAERLVFLPTVKEMIGLCGKWAKAALEYFLTESRVNQNFRTLFIKEFSVKSDEP